MASSIRPFLEELTYSFQLISPTGKYSRDQIASIQSVEKNTVERLSSDTGRATKSSLDNKVITLLRMAMSRSVRKAFETSAS